MNLIRYYHTVRYLRRVQIRYQLYYRARQIVRRASGFRYRLDHRPQTVQVPRMAPSIPSAISYANDTFTFLNQSHRFENGIDWDFTGNGKLWAYNLNYLDVLNQTAMPQDRAESVLQDFLEQLPGNSTAMEPYPISLRLINWVKFCARYDRVPSEPEATSFYSQALALADQQEKHLLGNHWLENGFGLLFAAHIFRDPALLRLATQILRSELDEQILPDGAHFELSPMYHQIILFRTLDSLNLVLSNDWERDELQLLLAVKAGAMLAWLQAITFSNGEVPLVNDAAPGIAPASAALADYARRLHSEASAESKPANPINHVGDPRCLESGYRMIRSQAFELFCDVGLIGPDYIPGHAHADTLSFVLYHKGRPIIIDPGVSTYEKDVRRSEERATAFHNTVTVGDRDSSEVWAAFRVGRRARITDLRESDTMLEAEHDGYRRVGGMHRRRWSLENDALRIHDTGIECGVARFHFHPDLNVKMINHDHIQAGDVSIRFVGAHDLSLETYICPHGFNRHRPANRIRVSFEESLKTDIAG